MSRILLILLLIGPLEAKFPWKELGMTLLLPGSAHYLHGEKKKACLFLGIDATLWTGYLFFKLHGRTLKEDYRIFGMEKAGADPNIEDEDYWKAVELYYSREKYIEYLYRVARSMYPDDPEAQREYVESHAISGDWRWKNRDDWFAFQDLIKASRVAYTRAKLSAFAALANRIAASIDFLVYYKFGSKDVGFLKDLRIRTLMLNPTTTFVGITAKF
jgi:hypothetical protein